MNTTTQQPTSNDLRHSILANDSQGNPMYIKIRLNDECNNGHQDFAITADIYQNGKPKIDKYFIAVGCCHEEILKARPDLKIFVDLHLCDYKGIPMYATANCFYFLRNGFNNVKPDNEVFKTEFCEYYRITPEQFDILNTSENEIQLSIHIIELGILDQWETQANKAISILEEMTGKKFLVDSKRTQFNAPTEEQFLAEKQKQSSGYYSPEAKEQRNKERQSAIHLELLEKRDKKINEIKTEYEVKEQILHIGGKSALDNCIYYNHTKTVAFNWKGYDDISDNLIAKIKSEIKLPAGVSFENKSKK